MHIPYTHGHIHALRCYAHAMLVTDSSYPGLYCLAWHSLCEDACSAQGTEGLDIG